MFRDRNQAVTEIVTIALFTLFQYLKFFKDGEWGSYQSLAYCILTLVMMLALVLSAASGRQEVRKPAGTVDWLLIALLILGMGSFLYKLFTARPDIERELIMLAVPLSYYVYSCKKDKDVFSIDLFLGTGTVICLVLYLVFFYGEMSGLPEAVSIDGDRWSSWLLLSAVSGMLLYCNAGRRRVHAMMGLFCSMAAFGLILLYQDVTLIYLVGLAILLLPVAHRPDREVLKRVLQIIFLWIAMLCNARFFLEIMGRDVAFGLYSVGCSAFLEVTAVIAGILVLLVWDNIPEEDGARIPYLRRMRRGMLQVLYLYGGFLFLLLTGVADNWDRDGKSWVDMAVLSQEWAECRKTVPNLFQSVYADWGMAGVLSTGLLFLFFLYQIGRRYRENRRNKVFRRQAGFLIPMGAIFAVQCLFWNVDAGTLPIYVWAVTAVLHGGKGSAPEAHPMTVEEIGT